MLEQRSFLRIPQILLSAGSPLLQQCKKLLWQDNSPSDSLMPLQAWNTRECSFSMLSSLQNMNHHIRTAFGDSMHSANWTTWGSPIMGIGQGNGAKPPIWAVVSSPMFNVLWQEGFYALIIGAISHLQHKSARFAFIDDTNLCVAHSSNDATKVTVQMQGLVKLWEGLLTATSGALASERCFWYLINFGWRARKWYYKSCSQHPATLHICNEQQHGFLIYPGLNWPKPAGPLGLDWLQTEIWEQSSPICCQWQ